MKNKKEIEALNTQLLFSLVSVATIFISIFLILNQKKYLKKEKPLIKSSNAEILSRFNRILILIVALVFLNINYKLKNISKIEGEDLKPYDLQIISSYLVVFSSLITLYVVFTSPSNESTSDIENPII